MSTTDNDVWEHVVPIATRSLSDEHRKWLREESAISDDVIDERGYYTLERPEIATLVAMEVIHPIALKAEGWLGIPITRPDSIKHGEIIRVFGAQGTQKYLWPTGERNAFDVHPYGWDYILDTDVPVVMTEGVKKADAVLSAARAAGTPLLVVAVNGNWGWHCKINKASVACPDFLDIPWKERKVYVIPDSDFRTNDNVRKGWSELASYLAGKTGSNRAFMVVPPAAGTAKQGADDFLAAGRSLGDLLELAQSPSYVNIDSVAERIPLRVKSGLALINEAGVRIPHIYDPLVPERAVMLAAGHSGTYKTWACLSLALDAAFGIPWNDHPKLVMHGDPVATLYVNKEMSGAILGQRLKEMARASRYSSVPDWEKIIEDRIFFADEAALDLNRQDQRDRLEDAIVECEAKIVVLDSLSMCWHGDENKSDEVGAFYAHLRGITERTGATWVIIHHLTKPQAGRKKDHPMFSIRGSGQLYQQADACLFLSHYVTDEQPEGTKELVFTHLKARTSREMPAWIIKFSDNDGLFTDMQYLTDLVDARARSYAKSYGDPTKLGAWIRESMRGMPALQSTGPGMRTGQLFAMLGASWNVAEEAPPSDQTMRRQIKSMTESGVLEVVETNRRLGDLYRLAPEEDDIDEIPPPVIS
jgi:hypothetical protein